MRRDAALIGLAAALLAAGAQAQPDPRANAVLAAIQGELGPNGFSAGSSYALAFSDLNDDHHPEAIVHLSDRNHCGSRGCTTFVLADSGAGWRPIGRISFSRLPIYRLPEHHNGWFDLGFRVGGGAIQPGLRAVRFDRGRYQSSTTKGRAIGQLPQEATALLAADSEFLAVGPN
jgi:hypothetical protein